MLVDGPPPGVGFTTVTVATPALAMSAAEIAAFNFVAVTNVVVRGLPLNSIVELWRNPVPLAVSVNAAPPAIALAGAIPEIVGTGFGVGAAEPPPHPASAKVVPQTTDQTATLLVQSMFLSLNAREHPTPGPSPTFQVAHVLDCLVFKLIFNLRIVLSRSLRTVWVHSSQHHCALQATKNDIRRFKRQRTTFV